MILLILSLAFLIGGIYCLTRPSTETPRNLIQAYPRRLGSFSMLLALGCFLGVSLVYIPTGSFGVKSKIYGSASLPAGQIVAYNGEKGLQADTISPGMQIIPFGKLIYDIETVPELVVEDGHYAILIAKDGLPLMDGEFIARPWEKGSEEKMLDAEYFLQNGGQKGPQYNVLKPARYRINPHLFAAKIRPALVVKTGEVAVLRSNIQTAKDCPNAVEASESKSNGNLSAPIVPNGCVGIQESPLTPGNYYKNDMAYVSTIIPTRAVNWSYKGGYTQREVKLSLSNEGEIVQEFTETPIATPKEAADQAINVRVEGWTVPVEMRVQVQVHPTNAPRVVASIGTLEKVEDVVVTPAIRDILRSIGGGKDRKVQDFIEKRDEITALVEKAIAIEAQKAGVTVQEVRMGEPAIPPEIMVARLREQLAEQMKQTFEREKEAQEKRIAAEEAKATADQQKVLVTAKLANEAADYAKQQAQKEGEGEKLRQMEIAQGRKALANVLGQDRTLQLELAKMILEVAKENPDIIKVPMVQVTGGNGSSLEGAAAVLGSSNFAEMMKTQVKAK